MSRRAGAAVTGKALLLEGNMLTGRVFLFQSESPRMNCIPAFLHFPSDDCMILAAKRLGETGGNEMCREMYVEFIQISVTLAGTTKGIHDASKKFLQTSKVTKMYYW